MLSNKRTIAKNWASTTFCCVLRCREFIVSYRLTDWLTDGRAWIDMRDVTERVSNDAQLALYTRIKPSCQLFVSRATPCRACAIIATVTVLTQCHVIVHVLSNVSHHYVLTSVAYWPEHAISSKRARLWVQISVVDGTNIVHYVLAVV